MNLDLPGSDINENSSTNHEAVLCKLSADICGLLPDKFISDFLNHPHHHIGHSKRHAKPPIINRGTFLRTIAIDSVVRDFLKRSIKSDSPAQIISLGAGFDTRLLRFADEFGAEELLKNLKYFEIDYAQVMDEKRRIIDSKPHLQSLSAAWKPISYDLNELTNVSSLFGPDLNSECPTLIIAECCLMYLTAEAGDSILSWASETFKFVEFCSFDPVLSDDLNTDRFAKTMLENFENRGLDTRSLLKYPSKPLISARFNNRFSNVQLFTMLELEESVETEKFVPKPLRSELMIKAALDEYEEWHLLAEHYAFVLAKN